MSSLIRVGLQNHLDTLFLQIFLHLLDAQGAKMEDRRRQENLSSSFDHTFIEMDQLPSPTGSNHRHLHGLGDGFGKLQVIAGLSPIPIHTGGQNHSRP